MSFETFIADPGRREVVLVDLLPWSIADDALLDPPLRFSSDKTPPGVPYAYRAQLTTSVVFEADTFVPGSVGEIPRKANGEIRIRGYFGDVDSLADPSALAWDGRTAIVRLGGYSPKLARWLQFSEYEARYYQIEDARLEGDELVVELRDQTSQFDDELQQRTFSESGWWLKGGGTTSDFVAFGEPAKLKLLDELAIQIRGVYKSTGAEQHLYGWPGSAFRLKVDSTDHLVLDWTKSSTPVAKTMTTALEDGMAYVFEARIADDLVMLRVVPETTRTGITETFSGSGFHGRDTPSAVALRAFLSFGGSNPSPSILDYVRVWSAERSDNLLRATRWRSLTTSEKADATLKHSLHFDDGTGTTVTDDSGTPANGTVNGTCPWYPSLLGSPEAAGNPMPDPFGPCRGTEPVPVSSAQRIYMWASTEVDEITRTLEGGIPHDKTADYTDVFDFLADAAAGTAADPGEFSALICPWGSYVVLGSNPERRITVDGNGIVSASSYLETGADQARYVMTQRGRVPLADPSGLDTASFTALNTAAPAPLKRYYRERIKRSEVLADLLGSVGAVVYPVRSTGLMAVRQFNGVDEASVLSLNEKDIVPGSMKQLQAARVSHRQVIGYAHCPTVQVAGEIAPGADQAEQAFYSRAYRYAPSEGDNRDVHPLAEEVKTDTAIADFDDAVEEANRRQGIFGSGIKPLEFVCGLRGFPLDRFQVVTVSYRDLSSRNRVQTRFALGEGSDRIVLGMKEALRASADSVSGTATVTVWG